MKQTCVFYLTLVIVPVANADWRSAAPITYNIDYQDGHVGSEEYLQTIREAAPDLVHVGEDVAFSSVFGTKDGYAGVQASKSKVLSPQEVQDKIREVTRYVSGLHQAGVQWVIPYINNQLILADPATRGGFLRFFDHWEQYQPFGFGPRPDTDILAARRFIPFQKLGYSREKEAFYPNKGISLCSNHPAWRQFLLAVTANLARCGYDGTFVDVMTLRDYCEHCQRQFRSYIAQKYPPSERSRRFGPAVAADLRLGFPGEGALWTDSQAFWSAGNAELLRVLRAEGAKTKPGFFVIPNLGPFAHADGVIKRASQGMDPAAWAPESSMIMFEEMQRSGRLRGPYFIDNILQYKLSFAIGARAGMLLYLAQEATGIELAMAEAGAGGGGALIQGYYRAPESRRKYRAFFQKYRAVFDGYTPLSDVAVLYDYEQLYWGNRTHLHSLYRLSDYLSRKHVQFDLVTPGQLAEGRLKRYKAVITPAALYLSDACVRALQNFATSGGLWVDIAHSARFDDAGIPRTQVVLRGNTLRYPSLDDLLPYPPFALYLLTEDQANELSEIGALVDAGLRGEHRAPGAKTSVDLHALLENSLKQTLSPLPGSSDDALRVHLWSREEKSGQTIAVHLVNYDCPIPMNAKLRKAGFELGGSPAEFEPKRREGIRVRVPVGRGRVAGVRVVDPEAGTVQEVKYEIHTDAVEFVVPEVRIYRVATVAISK